MSQLNFDNIGRKLAIINKGKFNKKIVSVYTDKTDEDDEAITNSFNSFTIKDEGKFQQLPNFDLDREIGYITAPSGAGKTTYICNYLKEWKKKHKLNNIYLFSSLNEDVSLDAMEPKRIIIDNTLLTQPIGIDDFKEGDMVLFDDIDVISVKTHREAVYKILNQILETGRHRKISCLVTNHLVTNGGDTRRILNECMFITIFFGAGSIKGINYLLENYIGMDKKEIHNMKKKSKDSRWTTIWKTYPQIALTEKNVWLLSEVI